MLDSIEYGIGIKAIQQDDRCIEPDTRQESEKPEPVHERQWDNRNLVAIEFQVARGRNNGG